MFGIYINYIFVLVIKQTLIHTTMKATYTNSKEIAELYILSGEKDRTDISALINESAKMLMQKKGKEEAMRVCMPFMQNKESLYTADGLASYLDAVGVDSISFADPFTGRIESTVYINLI